MGASRPTILAIEKQQGNCMATAVSENPTTLAGILEAVLWQKFHQPLQLLLLVFMKKITLIGSIFQ